MTYCPECKTELEDDQSFCPICGHLLSDPDGSEWIVLGEIEDGISADFARETLTAYEIPAVIFSRSGFFGTAGLPLNPFYKPGSAMFEIRVPKECLEEATDILTMTLGDKWRRKDK